jgi:hypothetical protein
MVSLGNSAETDARHFDPHSGEKSLKSFEQKAGGWQEIKQRLECVSNDAGLQHIY